MADTEMGINHEGEMPRSESKSFCQKFTQFLFNNLLLILMILSLILGCAVGFGVKLGSDRDFTSDEIKFISFPGTLFLNMLKVWQASFPFQRSISYEQNNFKLNIYTTLRQPSAAVRQYLQEHKIISDE